jgi:hypothetical protein
MERSTSEALQKSGLKTSGDSPSATGSPASEYGVTHYATLDGQMILPFGQAVAPAKVSVQAGSGKASQISVTYGPHGFGSFWSAVLTQSLASRLRAKTDSLGSTLFRLTWKERVTPSGRVIPRLVALAVRTSAKDCTSWPTPCQQDGPKGGPSQGTDRLPQEHDKTVRGNTMADHHHYPHDLSNAARMASWPNTKSTESHTGGMDLEGTATLANWATPTSRDHKDSPNSLQQVEVNCLLGRQALLTASGPTPSGSGAKTESSGQLNPAHSRWLMGLPPEWCACAVTATLSVRRRPRLS